MKKLIEHLQGWLYPDPEDEQIDFNARFQLVLKDIEGFDPWITEGHPELGEPKYYTSIRATIAVSKKVFIKKDVGTHIVYEVSCFQRTVYDNPNMSTSEGWDEENVVAWMEIPS